MTRALTRVALVATHPIQYQAPLFREMARRSSVDLTVLFCSDFGTKPSFDAGFGTTFKYDVPLLEGYEYEFLTNLSPRPHVGATGLLNPALAARVVANRYDAVVLHGYNALTNLLAIVSPHRRTRLLLRGDSNARTPTGPAKAIAKQIVLRALFSRVDEFLVSGTLNREYYARFGVPPDRMTFAPFSVDNAFFAQRAALSAGEREATRASVGVHHSGPVFVFAAKLQPHKRPLDLLRAFHAARAAQQTQEASLLYIGDGELRRALEEEIAATACGDAVKVLGFRNQSEMPKLLGAADVLVMPSEHEPWGLSVNEAMAAGLAIVVSDRVGCGPDLVRDNGACFPVGDVQALAAILGRWLVDREGLERARDASRRLIQPWDIDATADGYLRGIERAIAR